MLFPLPRPDPQGLGQDTLHAVSYVPGRCNKKDPRHGRSPDPLGQRHHKRAPYSKPRVCKHRSSYGPLHQRLFLARGEHELSVEIKLICAASQNQDGVCPDSRHARGFALVWTHSLSKYEHVACPYFLDIT